MVSHVYSISQVDYRHPSGDWDDEDEGKTTQHGAFATLKAANKEARRIAKYEANQGEEWSDIEKEIDYDGVGCMEITMEFEAHRWDDTAKTIIAVERQELEDAPEEKVLDSNVNEFGTTLRIPAGKPGGLLGCGFVFIGKLKSLDLWSCYTAVQAYGGWVASPQGGCPAPYYAVIGEDVTAETKASWTRSFGHRKLDEGQFYDLLKWGVPATGPFDTYWHITFLRGAKMLAAPEFTPRHDDDSDDEDEEDEEDDDEADEDEEADDDDDDDDEDDDEDEEEEEDERPAKRRRM